MTTNELHINKHIDKVIELNFLIAMLSSKLDYDFIFDKILSPLEDVFSKQTKNMALFYTALNC